MGHVMEWGALDHILFLMCLCVPYVLKDWAKVIWLVTFFTLGHTISLLLGAYGIANFKREYVEFIIPITILIAALVNIISGGKVLNQNIKLVYGISVFFGIIHGLAYYGDLKMVLIGGNKLLRILEVSTGVETAQLIIAFIVLMLGSMFQNVLRVSKKDWVLVVSSIALGLVIPMIFE
ncbi:MAG: HupE/UreJ family protein [Flavobacteriaceae bacterium]|nr:HupE/UreJ family protein [Flavobacteriaceae bacterium]